MPSTDSATYPRIRIHGQLECKSPLHIGDGGDAPFDARNGRRDVPGLFRTICLDADGRPYIPATTLRGHLRDLAGNGALTDKLFGHLRKGSGVAGKVRIFDARLNQAPAGAALPYWDSERRTSIQNGIALKPITGTVGDNLLFHHEVVPVDSRFSVELEADDLNGSALSTLLGLLEALDGGPDSALGRGTSRMQGRLSWNLDRVDVLTAEALSAWLDNDEQALADAFVPMKKNPTAIKAGRRPGADLHLRLRPAGPLLINEPGLAPPKRQADTEPDQDEDSLHEPDLEFSRTPDGRARIPASSLRGLLRARTRRILTTIAASRAPSCDAGEIADRLLGQLFGSTGRRARLWASDAIAEQPSEPLVQTFVAIDRFTGGGERHKLYKARAALCNELTADIRIDTRHGTLDDWEKGLLLLLARDALEGDLAAGWGKARGYGALDVGLEHGGSVIDSWNGNRGLLPWIDAKIGRATAKTWIDRLQQIVATTTEAGSGPA